MKFIDVSFSYGEKQLLDRFRLELPDSGVTALCGPSGCGKTTLLRLLCGLEKPQSGEIIAPKDTAVLFQENRLLPGLKVSEQIEVVLSKNKSAARWLKMVGLEGEEAADISTLSGGMQRRTAIARCLAFGENMQLLVLDEPFAGIDPECAKSIMKCIRTLGIPVVFSAHDAESLALADNVVRFEGPPLRELTI